MTQPAYDLDSFAFYEDGTESGSTIVGSVNSGITVGDGQTITLDTAFQLRTLVQETNNKGENNLSFQAQYNKNGAGWNNITDTSSNVRSAGSANLTDQDPTTQRIGAGTYITDNNCVEDVDGAIPGYTDFAGNDEVEQLFSIQVIGADVNDADVIDFRVLIGGSAPDTTTNTPTLTVNKVATTVNQVGFRFTSEDGPLDTPTWEAAANTDVNLPYGKPVQVWFEIEETNGGTADQAYELRYQKNGLGGYVAMQGVPYSGATSYPEIWGVVSDYYAHGDAITSNPIGQSAEPFTNGHGIEDTSGDVESNSVSLSNQSTVLAFTIRIPSLYDDGETAIGDVFDFRLYTAAGSEISGSYLATPRLTVENNPGHIGGTPAESQGKGWPLVASNGDMYYPCEFTEVDNEILMMKSTDGGTTWSSIDNAGRPGWTDLESLDVQLVGDTIHITREEGEIMEWIEFYVSTHSTNPDTWGTSETVASGYTNTDQSGAVAVRSDGSVIAFYRKTDGNEGIFYKIRSGGVWGAEQELDATANEFTAVMAIKGSDSDWVHVFYKDDTNGAILHRSIDPSDDSLTAVETVYSDAYTGGSGQQWAMTNPIVWDDGTDDYVMIGVQDDSDGFLYTVLITNDGTPGAAELVDSVVVESDSGGSTSRQPTASLAVDPATETVYCMFVDDATGDVWRYEWTSAGGWGTATEMHDGESCDELRAVVFTHSAGNGGGKVVGYIRAWDFGGYTDFTRYDEYEIAAASVTVNLNTAQLSADGQTLTVDAPITTSLNTAQLTASGQTLTVDAPVSVSLNTAQLTASGQTLTVQVASGVSLNTAQLTASGQTLSVDAPVTVSLNTATATASGQTLSARVTVSIALNSAQLTASGQVLTVDAPVSVALNTAQLNAQGQTLTVDAPVAISLNNAQLSAQGQTLTVDAPVVIGLNTAQVTAQGQPLNVQAVAGISLNTAQLSAQGQTLAVVTPVTVSLNTAQLTASGQTLVVDAPVAVSLNSAQLTAQGQPLTVGAGIAISLSTAQLTAQGQALTVAVDLSVSLSTAQLTAQGQNAVVDAPIFVSLSNAQLVVTGQTLAPQVNLSVLLSTASLNADGQTVTFSAIAVVTIVSLTAQDRSLNLTAHPRTLELDAGERN